MKMTNNFEHLSEDEFEELRKTFYSQAYDNTEDLQDLVLKLEADPGNQETLKALQRHFHTLKGDSNSIGLAALSMLCHRVEDILTPLRDGTRRIDPDTITLLLHSVETIENILRASETGEKGKDIGETVEMIDAFLRAPVLPGPRSLDFTEYQKLQMEEAQKSGQRVYEADIVFHPMCAEKSVAAFMLIQRLNTIGEIISSEPDITGEGIGSTERVSVVFSSDLQAAEVKDKLFIAGITGEINIRPIKNQGSEVSPATLPSPSGGEAGGENPEPGTRNSKSETLRVEASKVDWIMNLVGELIIGRSIIDQIAKDAEEREMTTDIASRLYSVNTYMERTVSDLQKGIMKMRMVPVNHIFRKFPKIVRELSVEKGKMVRLQTYGRDKELDKGIIDALGEPLLHIIRNSIDHGIERPDRRSSSGKPEEGVITLRAYHEATHIVLEVGDDGGGVDTERLKEKALRKGYVGADEIGRLTDSDAVNLIFVSGLSTSDTVTDISGRGIGMDAVKTAVENMKGTIEVDSSPGLGTKFTIRLPLTLAVIKALLFETGERLYALPVSAVSEVTRVMADDLITVNGKESLMLRDRIISIIRMDILSGTHPTFDKGGKKFVLILTLGGKKIGVLVDRLMGQQELVIKAVDNDYARSGLVSGASILGNGRIVLILDAVAVLKKAVREEKNAAESERERALRS